MRRLAWMIFALGVAALVLDPMRGPAPRVHPLALVTPGEDRMGQGNFAAAAVYPTTDMLGIPLGLSTRGSWIGSDAFEGGQVTPWFRARPKVALMVAGYPAPDGLTLEVRMPGGAGVSIPFHGENPGETWQSWTVPLPRGAEAVRVRAVDTSAAPRGWLAFSDPFRAGPVFPPLWPLLQLAAAGSLALTLLYGPGLLWHQSRPRQPGDFAVALLLGPLALAAVGLACWVLGGWFPPPVIARAGIAAILAAIAFFGTRIGKAAPAGLSREAAIVVAAGALFAGFAVAKANVSHGPAGELYAGTVSRTLEVGGHSDSRISYHVVQAIAHHYPPFSPQAGAYFSPYSFASRGPLAGFLAAPLVLATGAAVPAGMPDQRWEPFDGQGFAVYRIALIVLASLAGWAVFGVAEAALDRTWALLAAATLFLAPFFVHELFFTWPKLIAATCVLTAFHLLRTRRPLAAGFALGAGYLFHPLALLSVPFLGLLPFLDRKAIRWPGVLRETAWFGAGLIPPVLAWLAVGRLDPGSYGSQSGFATYLLMANGGTATWSTWWADRWQSLANTFIPFHLLWADPDNPELNSLLGRSDGWVHFGYLYWNTFPFAFGLAAFLLLAPALASGLARLKAVTAIAVTAAAGLLLAYWGADNTGLMRYCGHALFLASIPFAVWALAQPGPPWKKTVAAVLAHPLFIAVRGIDLAWMAFGTTLRNRIPDTGDWFGWNDWLSLLAAAAFLAGAIALLGRGLAPGRLLGWRPLGDDQELLAEKSPQERQRQVQPD